MIYQYHAINIKSRDDLRDIGPGKYIIIVFIVSTQQVT